MVDQSKLSSTISWLIAGAQPPKSIERIAEECASRLIDAGVPVDVFIVNGMFIHPQFRGVQVIWTSKSGVRRKTFARDYFESRSYKSTALDACVTSKRAIRYRFEGNDPETISQHRQAYQESGYTDLVLLPLFNFDGTVTGAVEIATKHSGGFDDDQIVALRRMQAPIARMKEYFTERFDKQITLATYVGEDTSKKVLNGSIALGDGEMISAVVMFADIKGFTAMSNASRSEDVLQVLNRFYASVDAAVSRNNGEILKFMGDGVLVIFPTPDDLTAQEAATSSAINSVAMARKDLAQDDTLDGFDFRASLHIGEVFFGNIGSGNRLDFTAIGPTVNLASRMLDEASNRNADTVCSKDFKEIAIGISADPITCEFKGFKEPVEIYILE